MAMLYFDNSKGVHKAKTTSSQVPITGKFFDLGFVPPNPQARRMRSLDAFKGGNGECGFGADEKVT